MAVDREKAASVDLGGKQVPMEWGGDAIAEMFRALDIEYIALNPGASYRGIHDSMVNYLGNKRPEMIVCLHEEHAVAIAHGYAKVKGRPMGAFVHSNVGLMHSTMAIFDAWCDRQPVLVFGATGAVDAMKRRPWIEWIHTARDQGALVRNYTKWDDQPASVEAALESMARANILAQQVPQGPTYLVFDVSIQEQRISPDTKLPDLTRHVVPPPPEPQTDAVAEAAKLLGAAKSPVIYLGRASLEKGDWDRRVQLAERLGAKVIPDLKCRASFPTDHPLVCGAPGTRINKEQVAAIQNADVLLALDPVDLGGALKAAFGDGTVKPRVIHATLDSYVANGWSMDYQILPVVDVPLLGDADRAVARLLDVLGATPKAALGAPRLSGVPEPLGSGDISLKDLSKVATRVAAKKKISFVRLPLRWPADTNVFKDPMDFLGYEGGGGVGSGPGMSVGSALALKGSGRIPVAILGDGDTLMGLSALWTAKRYRIPLLVVVANNRIYQNDVAHQDHIAVERERPRENKFVGQDITDPAPDFGLLVRGFDWTAPEGQVTDLADLEGAILEGLDIVEKGGCHLIDVAMRDVD
ncbi:MAG: hypothetical protein RLZ98_1757 [Pseudomonadota bacterium]